MHNAFLAESGTAAYIGHSRVIVSKLARERVKCSNCGTEIVVVTKDGEGRIVLEVPVAKPATKEEPFLFFRPHFSGAAAFFRTVIEALMQLGDKFSAGWVLAFSVFGMAATLGIIYSFEQMILQLSQQWSGTVQLLFRLLLLGVGLAAVVCLAPVIGRFLVFLGTQVRSLRSIAMGTRIWSSSRLDTQTSRELYAVV